MEIDYSKQHWDKGACPKVDCRKNSCKCGLKKVFLASALGDDSKDSPIAPKNGDYCNAIVVYEANGHIYIYSSEGIPTMMSSDAAGIEELEEAIRNAQSDIVELDGDLLEETRNRESGDGALQEEIDAIKNSPDVVDIVATYAALQTYDTSKLGDNDIVRVLADEQHDGASTYYRWNKQSSTWTYIGEVGDYYTKGQVDTLLADKQDELTAGENISIVEDGGSLVISALGNVRVLTTDDYNYPENNPSGVGIWKLETGVYRTEGSVNVYPHIGTLIIPSKYELLFVSGKSAYVYTMRYNGAKTMAMFSADRTTGVGQDEGSIFSNSLVVDNLTSTSTSDPLSANQGKTLKDMIDGLIISGAGAPTTSTVGTVGQLYEDTTNGKLYQCTSISGGTYTWSEVGGGGGGVTPVQTTGTSTTDVMSQDATTHMVYSEANPSTSAQGGAIYLGNLDANQVQQADPAIANRGWKYFWALPSSNTSKPINNSVCILGDIPYQTTGVAIGSTVAFGCKVLGSGGVAIGPDAEATQNSVAIGFMANASRDNTNNSSVIAIGSSAEATADYSICIGGGGSSYGVQNSASTSSITLGYKAGISGYKNSVALGAYSSPTRQGEVNVGLVKDETTGGYNNTAYRVIGGVHDPVNAHDAATKNYVDSIVINYATLTAAGAPTTSTAATSVGQLYYDSTNDDYYYCSAIDTTDPNNPVYTWSALSTGGGGGGDIVYSTKTTSNSGDGGAVYIGGKNANQDIYPDPTVTDNHYRYFWALPFNANETAYTDVPGNETLNIGGSQAAGGTDNVTVGFRSQSSGSNNVAIGYQAGSSFAYGSAVSVGASAECRQNYGVALGREAIVNQGHTGSVALGAGSRTTRQGEVYVGTNDNYASYNSSKLRVIGGVYDGQLAQDAVTVNQVNSVIDAINTALSTNIPHIGA